MNIDYMVFDDCGPRPASQINVLFEYKTRKRISLFLMIFEVLSFFDHLRSFTFILNVCVLVLILEVVNENNINISRHHHHHYRTHQ